MDAKDEIERELCMVILGKSATSDEILAKVTRLIEYREALISSALSAQAAEVERLKSDLAFAYSYFAPTICGPAFGEVYRRLEPYAVPPDAQEVKP